VSWSIQQLVALAEQAGFQGEAAAQAAAIAEAESGGNPNAVNPQSGAEGLWQFLPSTWAGLQRQGAIPARNAPWTDPQLQAQAAYALSRGGTNWSDWETWLTGAYRQFLPAAEAALGSVGSAPTGPASPPSIQTGAGVVPTFFGGLAQLIQRVFHDLGVFASQQAAAAFVGAVVVLGVFVLPERGGKSG